MANTTSIAFPNMFDVSRNTVGVLEDNVSIVNRTRLLMLTDPTELYNSPTFGVGLKRYLWQYNTVNTKALIQDRIKEQLRMFEPCVNPDETSFADGLLATGGNDVEFDPLDYNRLKMTVGLRTIYRDDVEIDLNDASLQDIIDHAQEVVSKGLED